MHFQLKKIIPNIVLDYLQKRRYQQKHSRFTGKSTKVIFNTIHQENTWGSTDTASGQGSTLELCSNAIALLTELIGRYELHSILDLPCGDFNWMQEVPLTNIKYLGGDIVQALIDQNTQHFGTERIQFQQLDLLEDTLPQVDLILVRDCLVHFSYEDCFKAIKNLKRSKSTYLLTTTFPKQKINYDINTGDWRPINLRKKPFHFPAPLIQK
ncbi:MAG: class I SAM-dependent methyltransferase, partial [Bacteroidota bacterium]